MSEDFECERGDTQPENRGKVRRMVQNVKLFTQDYCAIQFRLLDQLGAQPADLSAAILQTVHSDQCIAWLNAQALIAGCPDMAVSVNQYSGLVH